MSVYVCEGGVKGRGKDGGERRRGRERERNCLKWKVDLRRVYFKSNLTGH